MTGPGGGGGVRARHRPRLRNRIVARVGLLVAGLALALGATTYFVVRDVVLGERDQSAVEQFSTNAVIIAASLRSEEIDEFELLSSLRPEVRARELLFADGQWFTASLQFQPDDLPDALVDAVRDGRSSTQRFSVDGSLVLALGTQLEGDALYFEVFSLEDVRRTLSTLRNTLIGVGIAATLGGMIVARWIGRRIAGPLESVSHAAAGIAQGDLRTRLDTDADEEVALIAESFNRMADSLEARIERESRFAADVSHELRSPLTTLVNTVSVLERRRHELSPEGAEALTLLAGDVKRFERMVTDLIEISKHDSGSMRFDLAEVEAADAIPRMIRRLGHGDIPVDIATSAGGALIRVDLQRFEVAIRNVLANAAAYAGGATKVTIEVSNERLRMLIDDDGPGVPIPERDHIFERFARGEHGERRHTADGSGLGLSLARENIERMGGSIHVETAPNGRGARFVLALPRTPR